MLRHPYRSAFAVLAVLPLAFSSSLTPGWAGPGPDRLFEPVATVDVDGEVAEILAATPDRRTVLYTDSALEGSG